MVNQKSNLSKVVEVSKSVTKKYITIVLENNISFRVTNGHKILTDNGYTDSDKLKIGDVLLGINQDKITQKIKVVNVSSTSEEIEVYNLMTKTKNYSITKNGVIVESKK